MMDKLLNKNITRLEILKSKSSKSIKREVTICVYRNHSFEHMEGVINKFLNQSGLNAKFLYSDYDDSFNFQRLTGKNDINIIWIDFSRYNDLTIDKWFNERLELLNQISDKPILVYYIGVPFVSIKHKDIIVANSNEIEKELGDNFYDREKFEYSGTNISSKASIRIAQELGFKFIPSFFLTPIKAIVTDLDNTFYSGILGEDGIENLVPNIEYQKQLLEFKKNGGLLAIASKNEFEDVKEMFEKRKDFIIKWNDFSSHNISWSSKDKSIFEIAEQFNIGIDSILFIDDNIGEINLVKNCYPLVNTLLADQNLNFKLNIYPLMERYLHTKEDNLRASDIEANQKREELKNVLNVEEYFKSLEMKITYALDNIENFERAVQLINKTNQFIFSYKRYAKEDIKSNMHILTINLKDKLSDSGIIGIIIAENIENKLIIDELVVSCRALGRNIENIMLNNAFVYLKDKLGTSNEVIIDFHLGPRNNPAKNWLENFSQQKIECDCCVNLTLKDNIENQYIQEVYN